jgi:probable phosphoglycerate mutase
VIVEADGGSRGNPGPAGYGAVVLDERDHVLAERAEAIGVASNNVAEYRGLIAGLQAAAELGARVVRVRMDSKLVVEQMSGNWQVKHEGMRVLARQANALRTAFDEVTFQWIPRAQNTRADRLANEAMDRAAGIAPRVRTVSVPARVEAPASVEETPTQQPLWTPPTDAPTRLVLVRHGATEHTADRRFSGRNDLPLSAAGAGQAAAVAARLAAGAPVAAVVSSPLRRCVQTAERIAEDLGTSVAAVDGLAEVDFGEWEGLTMTQVRQRYPQQLTAWFRSEQEAPPGGESFAEVARRVLAARDEVVAKYPLSTVVVVSHVTPIKQLVRDALHAPPISLFRLHLDPASVSTIDYFADGNCSVRLVNDTSHLVRSSTEDA